MSKISIDVEGFQEFEIRGVTFTVDVFDALVKLDNLQTEFSDGKGGHIPHLLQLVRDYGGPNDVSVAEAMVFAKHIDKIAEEKKGFFAPTPSSPPSTDSTAST